MYKSKKELLERNLTKQDLLRCKYKGSLIGFELDYVKLDDLLSVDDLFSLPVSQSINTECGLLTWVLSAGWILVPKNNEELDWYNFETLADFLERNKVFSDINGEIQKSIEGVKVRLLREYLDELQGSLESVNNLMTHSEDELDIDLFILLIKDYRTGSTQNLFSIKKEIEKEIVKMERVLDNLINNKKQSYSIAN